MREIVHLQAGQCGNQIGAKVSYGFNKFNLLFFFWNQMIQDGTHAPMIDKMNVCLNIIYRASLIIYEYLSKTLKII